MDDETTPNRTGRPSAERAVVDAPSVSKPAVPPAVPPMEAEWLRVVTQSPATGRRNGAGAEARNGHPGGGVDSSRGGH